MKTYTQFMAENIGKGNLHHWRTTQTGKTIRKVNGHTLHISSDHSKSKSEYHGYVNGKHVASHGSKTKLAAHLETHASKLERKPGTYGYKKSKKDHFRSEQD